MWKAVNGLLSNVAASLRTNVQALSAAWGKVDESYGALLEGSEGIDDPTALERSRLGEHLRELVRAVVEEEAAGGGSDSDTGPCFEFLLQQNVVDKLCALGLPDRPPGMRSLITSTLDDLFKQTRKPLLPNMTVHLAVRQFISICDSKGDLRRPSYKRPFLSLMRTLCAKLRDDPSLAWVFFENRPSMDEEFLIFKALLPLLNDDDADGDTAVEGILCCVQLPDQKVTRYIIEETEFAASLVAGLRGLFARLPPVVVGAPPGAEDLPETADFVRAWTRLRLVDVVAASTHPDMARQVAACFRDTFLFGDLRPRLLSVNEEEARWATVYVRSIVERLEADVLRTAVAEFLLGGSKRNAETQEEEKTGKLRATLIRRIDSLNEALGQATLGLFDSVLAQRGEGVYCNLLLRNLADGRHLAPEARDDEMRRTACAAVRAADVVALFEGVEGKVLRDPLAMETYLMDAQAEAQAWAPAYERWSRRARPRAAGDGQQHVRELSLDSVDVPSPSSSRQSLPGDGLGHGESDGAGAGAADGAADGAGPKAGAATPAAPGDDRPFYEGLFLRTLLRVLEAAFDKPFGTILLATSVLTRMAQCPHPQSHTLLLHPGPPVHDGVSALIPALAMVWHNGRRRAEAMPDYPRRLDAARARLEYGQRSTTETQDEERFLHAMIVLEEFVKELCAVATAKSQLQSAALSSQLYHRHSQPPQMLTE